MNLKQSTLTLLVIVLCFFYSCKKEAGRTDFAVNGLSSLQAKVYDTLIINLEIIQQSGEPEKFNLTLTGVPKGLEYSFDNSTGISKLQTRMVFIINDKIRLGNHSLKLNIVSDSYSRELPFDLSVEDVLSLSMTVFDASRWSLERPAGEPVTAAKIRLFPDSVTLRNNIPIRVATTDSSGTGRFYHMNPGVYFFKVSKGGLSNISAREEINGKSIGLAIVNLDRHGQLVFKDQDGDGRITINDRVEADILILYENKLSEKTIWIGR